SSRSNMSGPKNAASASFCVIPVPTESSRQKTADLVSETLPALKRQFPDEIAIGHAADHERPLAVISEAVAAIERLGARVVFPDAEIDRPRAFRARPFQRLI